MKRPWKILTAIIAILALLISIPVTLHFRAKARLESYKKQLIAAGEKLTIAELIPSRSTGENGAKNLWTSAAWAKRFVDLCPRGMRMIFPGKAQAGWQRVEAVEEISSKITTNLWPLLAAEMALNTNQLAGLHEAIHQPEFYFSIDYNYQGNYLPLSHLPAIKQVEWEFEAAMLFQLHEGRTNEAFENLLAIITLPRVYKDEPLVISQLVRYADISIAFDATWAALQYDGWTDAQLDTLQREWDTFEILPHAISALAMERALGPKQFEKARNSAKTLGDSMAGGGKLLELNEIGETVVTDPAAGWQGFLNRFPRYWAWKWIWSYDDERRMMEDWQEGINGVKTGYFKNITAPKDDEDGVSHPRFLMSRGEWVMIHKFVQKAFQPMTQAQTILTAIALKRCQKRTGKYPATLKELVPEYLKKVPLDYMDGQELRYHLKPDGTFLLYSVGQNGTDEGGDPTPVMNRNPAYLSGQDWVWPLPATAEEVKTFEEQEAKKRKKK